MEDRPLRIAVLNWRDTTHPEGGGSERYVERVAADMVADGCEVTIHCARHPGSAARSRREGVTFARRGGRFGVYPRTLLALLGARLRGRAPDVVLDVHNGVPFFARLVAGRPVVVLVHHVHREQWRVVLGPFGARLGWWLESWLSPRVHRGCQYIAVSEVTRRELTELGVRADDVAVVHNGGEVGGPVGPSPAVPTLVVLGRLVPHKRVEHALDVLAALRPEVAGLRLVVVGEGWWHDRLVEHAADRGVRDHVVFTGFVSEADKHAHLAAASVLLAPSVKEGWGLMVVEAGAHGVPTVAYDNAGGLSESVVHGRTGLLVPDFESLVAATRQLLLDDDLRTRLGGNAREYAGSFTWWATSSSVHGLLRRAAQGAPPVAAIDPAADRTIVLPVDRPVGDRLSS